MTDMPELEVEVRKTPLNGRPSDGNTSVISFAIAPFAGNCKVVFETAVPFKSVSDKLMVAELFELLARTKPGSMLPAGPNGPVASTNIRMALLETAAAPLADTVIPFVFADSTSITAGVVLPAPEIT